ncbi:single-stranded DNA-binding protein, partial [Streptococcus infantis]
QAELMAQSLSKGSPILLKGEIIQRPYNDEHGQRRTYQFISPNQQGGITFLENKEASNRRKQEQQGFSQPTPSSNPPSYPEPMDVESPF